MALTMFKKPRVLTQAEELAAELDALDSMNVERSKLNTRMAQIRNDKAATEEAEGRLQGMRDGIDIALAEARINDAPAPDVSEQRRALADAEKQIVGMRENVRVNALLLPRLQATFDQLTTLSEQTKPKITRMVWYACQEEMASHAAELAAAEEMLRAVHRKVFIAAKAADNIAQASRYGQFVASGRFGDLNISKPLHGAFFLNAQTPEQEHNARIADVTALAREADQFINYLLSRREV
jgi:hypothetical protein